MLPAKDRMIDGDKYTVSMLDAWASFELFPTIAKVILPAIGGVTSAMKGGISGANMGEVAAALNRAFDSVPPKQLVEIAQLLFASVAVDLGAKGRQQQLMPISASHFQGRILSMLKVLKFALEVNYADFWQGLQLASASASSAKGGNPTDPSPTPPTA